MRVTAMFSQAQIKQPFEFVLPIFKQLALLNHIISVAVPIPIGYINS